MNKSKYIHITAYTILAILLIWLIYYGTTMKKRNEQLSINIENQYNRAFTELVGYVDSIETDLNKGMLVSSASQLASLSNDIFRTSTSAKACLGQLPVSEVQLDNTAKFLSQVGDYTYVLSQNMINGGSISDEDYKNISSLTKYAGSLNKSLSELQTKIYNGEVTIAPVSTSDGSGAALAASGDIFTDLENVEKSFSDYPSLIYDGPFSEHIENKQSILLQSAREINADEALKKANEFTNNKYKFKQSGESKNTSICAYDFCAQTKNNEICVSVTKNGGYILYYLNNRSVKEEKLNFTDAIKYASDFLQKHGFTSMESSYFDKAGHIATINFAYTENGITCYSDLIKVKVALDNGEILGLETNGYLMNHTARVYPEIKLSPEEANGKLNQHLTATSYNLAMIPKDSLEEVLCYEFNGTYNDKNFIVYINAENGREEKILMLIESDEGILTV